MGNKSGINRSFPSIHNLVRPAYKTQNNIVSSRYFYKKIFRIFNELNVSSHHYTIAATSPIPFNLVVLSHGSLAHPSYWPPFLNVSPPNNFITKFRYVFQFSNFQLNRNNFFFSNILPKRSPLDPGHGLRFIVF